MDGLRQAARSYERRAILVGKADQDFVIAQLCEHYSDGRLTMPELEARVESALFAHTDVRLAELLDDLPVLVRRESPPPPTRHTNVRRLDSFIDRCRELLHAGSGWPVTH